MPRNHLFALLALLPTAGWCSTSDLERQLAEYMSGTLFVKSHRETADGQLSACGFEFAAIGRDFATKASAPVLVNGSYYIRTYQNNFGYALKVGVRDGMDGSAKAWAPANAFLRDTNGIAPKNIIRTEAETPGYALFIGALDDSQRQVFEGIMKNQKTVLGFNRKKGQQDVHIEIDLTVKDSKARESQLIRERSNEMVEQFAKCIVDLSK